MVLKRLADNGNSLLDDKCGFDSTERVALDGIRGIGQLEVIEMLKVSERLQRQGPQFVEPLLCVAIEVRSS